MLLFFGITYHMRLRIAPNVWSFKKLIQQKWVENGILRFRCEKHMSNRFNSAVLYLCPCRYVSSGNICQVLYVVYLIIVTLYTRPLMEIACFKKSLWMYVCMYVCICMCVCMYVCMYVSSESKPCTRSVFFYPQLIPKDYHPKYT